jgi:cell division protein FtsN
MPKDYKDAPAPRESRLAHPLLLGMIIGLLLGIVISLAVALWLNRLNNPFLEKGKQVEPVAKFAPPQGAPPAEAAKAAEQAAKGKMPTPEKAEKGDKTAPEKTAAAKPGERPRFEFYQILPGEKAADKPAPDKDAGTGPTAPRPPSTAGSKQGTAATPKPHSGETYWLQAGAFTEEREADNLKARIALTGLEASVRPVNVPDKGTLYRVRLGPYQSLDDANRIKTALSQNGVGAAIIRTTDEAKKQ